MASLTEILDTTKNKRMRNLGGTIRCYPIRIASYAACVSLVFGVGCQPTGENKASPNEGTTAQPALGANAVSGRSIPTGLQDSVSNTNSNIPPTSAIDDNRPASRAKVQPHPKTSSFTDAQLNKDHTLCVLAFDSFSRHNYFLSLYRHLMSPEQIERGRALVDSFEPEFSDLARQRELILNTATDNTDVATLLKNNNIEVLLTSRRLRRRIMHEIYTREQLQKYNEEYEAEQQQKMAAKKRNRSK